MYLKFPDDLEIQREGEAELPGKSSFRRSATRRTEMATPQIMKTKTLIIELAALLAAGVIKWHRESTITRDCDSTLENSAHPL